MDTDELEALALAIRAALDRRDFRTADELLVKRARLVIARMKARRRAHRAERFERRAERRAQREAWPTCGAPRADGSTCQARTMWLAGEPSPRTRCSRHGGRESPNVPRIRPTSAAE